MDDEKGESKPMIKLEQDKEDFNYSSEHVKEEQIKVEPDIGDVGGLETTQPMLLLENKTNEEKCENKLKNDLSIKCEEETNVNKDDIKISIEKTITEKFSCSYCGKDFKLLYYLDRHLVKHTGEKKYQCDECPRLFAYKQDLPRHKQTHRTDRVLLQCSHPSCGKSFTTKHALTVHQESHGESFVCDHCGKSFVSKQRLETHTVKVHTKQYSLFCDKCSKGYLIKERNRAFKNHTEKCGLKEKKQPRVCELCGKMFLAKCAYDRHMISHSKSKDFPCNLCGKAYADKQNLVKHLKIIHPDNQ